MRQCWDTSQAPKLQGSEVKAMLVAADASPCPVPNPCSSSSRCALRKAGPNACRKCLLQSLEAKHIGSQDKWTLHPPFSPQIRPSTIPTSTSPHTPTLLSSAKPQRPGQSFHHGIFLIATTNSSFPTIIFKSQSWRVGNSLLHKHEDLSSDPPGPTQKAGRGYMCL